MLRALGPRLGARGLTPVSFRRCFADKIVPKTVNVPKTPVPNTAVPKTPTTGSDVGETLAAQAKIPVTTTLPKTTTPPPPKTPPKAPLPPPRPGVFRRLGRFGARLFLLTTLAYGGGLLYSRYNDNFHDFFTEYVPFAEQAVLYLEELDFRKRYGDAPSHRSPQAHDTTVPVAPGSGVSWRVADAESGGRTSSAVKKAPTAEVKEVKKPEVKEVKEVKSPEVKESKVTEPKVTEPKVTEPKKVEVESKPKPQVTPARSTRLKRTQLLDLPDAQEPIVQDVVLLLNDLITVINADNEQWKYAGAIARAQDRLGNLGDHIRHLKAATEAKAGEQVRAQTAALDKEVNSLIERFDRAVLAKEQQWREELTSELERVRGVYEGRVRLLLDREKQTYDEKLRAQLDAQAIALRRELQGQVRDQLEREREGRLSKLEELSTAVNSLQQLTTGWGDVVDGNLRTQQLHVALEAVRARIHDAEHNPRPFVRELVALKQVADEDPVVDAAVASIPPAAYQRGVPSAAALVDRFRRVATEVRKAALLPDDAGLASHVGSWALSKVLFKRDGAVVGVTRDGADDVEGVLAKTQMLLEEGDLDGAAREMNGLSGWAKALSKDWLGEVRKVLELQQALDVISTEARLESLKMEATR
jgi:mitofilin